ncbi:MAG TPA: assimilatory sulfite reductase (NADPH) flavoprotein subunit [Woeseiaceae bacterium]|nr:assimilatory sulfite reductase (NADPH) flavoprotein subunit [Woeseiaceae bacterium]
MSAITANSYPEPLPASQAGQLEQALIGLTPMQLQWASGYAAGLAVARVAGGSATTPASNEAPGSTLTVLFASQTGNGEGIAKRLAMAARDAGCAVNLVSLADYKPTLLKREKLAIFVISTHGEGDPPDDAELFHEFLQSAKAPRLGDLYFSVLALGDSSYVNFCQAGREFDQRIADLGGTRLTPVVECDVDFEDAAASWVSDIVARVPDLIGREAAVPQLRAVGSTPRFDRNSPFDARVLVNQQITGRDSSKDVRHIELSLEGSGLRYEPGDALAVIAENPPELVADLLGLLGLDGATRVSWKGTGMPLFDALLRKLEITSLNLGLLRKWAGLSAAASGSNELQALLDADDNDALAVFLATHQLIDVVRLYPIPIDAQSLVDALRKLSPRSYSIASSQHANPDEVHLTVAAVRYQAFGSLHWGAASTHLADRLHEGASVSVYIEPNSRFHLPPKDDTDVIMIGPGTGIAPFRSFIEERGERNAAGRNWLFFGDRNFASDFLYQLEWQRYLKSGLLTRLDLAFSRDQARKIYVQDRIVERGAELWQWISSGAHVYVCGDAKRMAGDVDAALINVIQEHAKQSAADAGATLKELRRNGRYHRDVY